MTTTVFHNGAVFTADAARSWASAVAVVDGRIAAIGGSDAVTPFVRRADDVVDLDGRALWPAFHDAHAHPVNGGLERARCDLSGDSSAAGYTARIAEYLGSRPDREWVLGGGWSMEAFPGGRPTREALDAVTGDRLVYLPNRDHHSAWVNSRTLLLAGIDASTPDPADGRIERDSAGRPTGLLHEGAMDLVAARAPQPTQEEYDEGLREAQHHLHALGVVGWQDAMVRVQEPGPTVHESYLRAQAAGWLTAHVAGALWWDRDCDLTGVADQVAALAQRRDEARVAGSRYRTESVKIMQDGVVETFTAALLEPYLDRCGHRTANDGLSFLPVDVLDSATAALDAAGFGVHFHALGDRAVREVLDALTNARRLNGATGNRHHLAHLQVVDPADVPRFARLGATANLQALWACHEPQMDELSIPFLGSPRAERQYPFGDLHRAGATLAMGSDWPVSSPDPLAALHVAVNRTAPETPAAAPFLLEQALSLPVALAAYTAGSAHIDGIDDRSGSITVGKDADLVVLDRNPFAAPPCEIGEARVQRTYVAGRLVHAAG
ncbi:amidohydrolase family protein [Blastococcus sp. BMG 814]|uniref:Amidohydrolase family protein n=1 Tax=Blastococcus carthaginiensis TaxID=3050034 RepID=A0ABT9IDH1_9ACTN|nr:amidohydrolase [Blastococcus carthaginiensis]MDP5183616.1 amidohydrolase family protein [Blastococcus carthaginiensis]